MNYWEARVARIKSEIPISQVLYDLGYNVHPHNNDHEWQFSCDLHGSGQDLKPSARLYPDDNVFYCFGCAKQRDAIELLRDKEGLGFAEACKKLEERYKLGPFKWDGEVPWDKDKPQRLSWGTPQRGFDDEYRRVHTLLETLLRERSLEMMTTIRLFEALDAIEHFRWQEKRKDPESGGSKFVGKLAQIREQAMESLKHMKQKS